MMSVFRRWRLFSLCLMTPTCAGLILVNATMGLAAFQAENTVATNPDEAPAAAEVPAEESAQEVDEPTEETVAESPASETEKVDFTSIHAQFRDLKKLSKEKDGELWYSTTDKIVMVGGKICLERGQLEMFACTPRTKEHESIVVISCRAFNIHAGLLAIGATQGRPVSYDPEYTPASGSEIEIEVHWFDEAGKAQKVRAQEWIRDASTQEQMKHPWVFAGSGMYRDEDNGQQYYMAEGGEVFCLSNFSTALLDLPVESSDLNDGLLFEAFEGRIPPRDTPVRMVLRVKEKEAASQEVSE